MFALFKRRMRGGFFSSSPYDAGVGTAVRAVETPQTAFRIPHLNGSSFFILPSTFPECCRRRAGSVIGDKKRGQIVQVKAGPNLARLR